jgi:1-acyl-sn-glycerol-3-phosphate acyltransferase
MPARILTAWRALRTGVAFAALGLISLWLGAVWLPFRGLWDRRTPERWRRAQRAIHRAYRLHARLMEALGLIAVRWVGAERLEAPGRKLIVANHPSLIDTLLIVSQLPQADCVVGREYAENFWLRGAVREADYIRNDVGAAEIVRVSTQYLSEDRTVLIFPEGTRSPEGGLGPFQRGAAHIALASGLDMLPIRITVEPPSLMKGQKWYHVPPRRPLWTFRVGEPLVAKEYLDGTESTVMAARKLTTALRERFEGRSLDATE